MSFKTNFVDKATVVVAGWFNDANKVVYDLLGDGTNPPATKADVQLNLGVVSAIALAASTGAGSVGFLPAGAGAVATTVQAKLRKTPDAASGFWPDAAPAGNIQRLYDRVFVGGATLADGTLANVGKDWLETERLYTTRNSQMAVTSTIGQLSILGGSRTSDSANVGSEGCIGVGAYAINNNVTQIQSAYAGYFEARRKAGAGITHGIELDIVNQGNVIGTNPYAGFAPTGMTNGLWIASGGGVAGAVAASVAIGIVNNGASFASGIVFQANSILGTDGVTGIGDAFRLVKGHSMTWFNSAGNQTSYVYSAASGTTVCAGLILDDGRVSLVNTVTGARVFETTFAAGDANYIGTTSSTAGLPPNVQAFGTDANIDVRLAPKGTGVLAVTYGSVLATTPSAFSATRRLAFKDGNNTIWYLPVSTVPW